MMKESLIIDKLRAVASDGLLDDAALYNMTAGFELVVTTDMLVEGVHFLSSGAPQEIITKAIATNISDIAAMGATPVYYQLALGLTDSQDASWIDACCSQLQELHKEYRIGLSGGDTVRGCSQLTICITMHGIIEQGRAVTRAKAASGDNLYVTGTLGDAALGLHMLRYGSEGLSDAMVQHAISRYWTPKPQPAFARRVGNHIHAMMDVSDGLMTDAATLCGTSDVGAIIEYDSLPLSSAMSYCKQVNPELFDACISAGDDYELLFAAAPIHHETIINAASRYDLRITKIGKITEERQLLLRDGSGVAVALLNTGYQH
jgi:thiamine-monophosphate kinase